MKIRVQQSAEQRNSSERRKERSGPKIYFVFHASLYTRKGGKINLLGIRVAPVGLGLERQKKSLTFLSL